MANLKLRMLYYLMQFIAYVFISFETLKLNFKLSGLGLCLVNVIETSNLKALLLMYIILDS